MTVSTKTVPAIRGGITLAPDKPGLNSPIKRIPLPATLVFNANASVVNAGDQVLAGQAITADTVASTSGKILSVGNLITLAPDGKNTVTPKVANAGSSLETIEAAGLKGLGGAGFSTAQKLNSQRTNQLDTLIINAAECEPMIACDEALMQEYPNEITQGIGLLIAITSCKVCMLAIEDNKPAAIAAMSNAIAEYPNIQLVLVPARYPGGAETVLLRQLTGKQLLKNDNPADHGLLCLNVATAYSVYHACQGQPLFGRVVSIGGNACTNPCNVFALYGTSLWHLLEQTGNAPAAGALVTVGGPISGRPVANDQTTLKNYGVTAKCNSVIIQSATPLVPEQACIRCSDCADACPESLYPQQLFRYKHDTDQLKKYRLDQCIECRCCDLVCPSHIKLTDQFIQSKAAVKAAQQLQLDAQHANARFAARESRLARKKTQHETGIKAALQRAKKRAQKS